MHGRRGTKLRRYLQMDALILYQSTLGVGSQIRFSRNLVGSCCCIMLTAHGTTVDATIPERKLAISFLSILSTMPSAWTQDSLQVVVSVRASFGLPTTGLLRPANLIRIR